MAQEDNLLLMGIVCRHEAWASESVKVQVRGQCRTGKLPERGWQVGLPPNSAKNLPRRYVEEDSETVTSSSGSVVPVFTVAR